MVTDCFVLRNSLIVLLGEPNLQEGVASLAEHVGCILRLAFASACVLSLDLCYSPVMRQAFGTKKHSSEQGRRVREKRYQRESDCFLLQETSCNLEQGTDANTKHSKEHSPSIKGFLPFSGVEYFSETCLCKVLCEEILPCSSIPTLPFHLFLNEAAFD